MHKYEYVRVRTIMFMFMYKLCVCIRGGATLETLSLSLRSRDGGLVPTWYHICYVMIDSGMVV